MRISPRLMANLADRFYRPIIWRRQFADDLDGHGFHLRVLGKLGSLNRRRQNLPQAELDLFGTGSGETPSCGDFRPLHCYAGSGLATASCSGRYCLGTQSCAEHFPPQSQDHPARFRRVGEVHVFSWAMSPITTAKSSMTSDTDNIMIGSREPAANSFPAAASTYSMSGTWKIVSPPWNPGSNVTVPVG